MTSTAALCRRVSRLEEARPAGALTKNELAELRRLEAQYDVEFAGCMHDWSTEKIYEYIISHSIGARDGWMWRLDILKERNDTPEQRAADRQRTCRMLGLTEEELEDELRDGIAQLEARSAPPSRARGASLKLG